MFPKIGVPPNHPFLIRFSIIFTIHFGVPLFSETGHQQTGHQLLHGKDADDSEAPPVLVMKYCKILYLYA